MPVAGVAAVCSGHGGGARRGSGPTPPRVVELTSVAGTWKPSTVPRAGASLALLSKSRGVDKLNRSKLPPKGARVPAVVAREA